MELLDGWQLWLIASLLLLLCELLDGSFLVTCFAVGALFSALVAACGLGLGWQLVAFAIGAVVAFACVRPLALKFLHRKNRKEQQMQIDSMAGREVRVVERVDGSAGRVAIDGIDWKAVSVDGEVIEKGETGIVAERKGNTLLIHKS